MADALASAHASGIVHRDIKPDNVLLTGHHALVTDFGVAKALAGAVPEDAAESSRALPTTSRFTSLGVALGTPAYMSPEQAAADPMIDHRSDIYSLGVLAYEMLTGCPPFTGMQPQQLLAAHLSQTPEPISAHRPSVPPELESLVMRCLEKHAADRWQSAAELQSQLEAMATPGGGMAPAAASVPRRSPARDQLLLRLGVGVAVVAGLLVVARMWLARPAPAWVIGATVQITNTPGLELDAAVSPDGRLVAYAAGPIGSTRIFVRQVGGGEPRLLTQSVGGAQRTPRWSPDGQTITFLVGQSLYAAPALGGTARMVWNAGDYEFASPVLSPDGQRVAWAEQSAIHVASVSGGERRKLADAHYPSFLVWSPDGRHLAYVSDNAWFIYGLANLGNLSPSSIWIVSVSGGRPVRVTETASLNTSPLWSPDGRSLFFISSLGGGRDVYAQALSSRRRPRGAPVRLTTGLTAHSITFNADGSRLAYSVLTTRSNLWWAPITPARATPFSAARAVTNENQTVEGMGISRNGTWLVYDSDRQGPQQIYRIRVDGGEPIRVTHDSADNFLPSWSPDGRQIAYHSWRSGNRDLYVIDAEGGVPQAATTLPGHEMYPIWSPSGDELLFIGDRTGRWEMHSVRCEGNRWGEPRQLTDNFGYNGRWSADGRSIVYISLLDTTLHVISAEGTDRRLLFDGHALGLTPLQVAFGHRSDVVYFHAVDSAAQAGFYEIPLRGGAPRLVLSFPDPGLRPRRPEFDTDGRRLYFTVATDESDVWMMHLRRQ